MERRVLLAASLVSVNSTGTAALGGEPGAEAGTILNSALSPDGRYLLFRSTGTKLVAGVTDTNNAADLFVRDLQNQTTSILSVDKSGNAIGSDRLANVKFNATSDFLIFISPDNNLASGFTDTNDKDDLFARNLATGATSIVTANPSKTAIGYSFTSDNLVLSPDGKLLAYEDLSADVVSGVTDTNAAPDSFVYNFQTGTNALVSVAAAGGAAGNADSFISNPVFSADSKMLAFKSKASNLVAGVTDTNGTYDLFIRNLETNTTSLLTVNAAGNAAGNASALAPIFLPDGQSVIFQSAASDLATGVTDGSGFDLFQRNLQSGTTTEISLNAAGDGTGGVSRASLSPGGRYLKFWTTAPGVVSGTTDTNGSIDVFIRDLQTNETIPVSFDAAGNALGLSSLGQPTKALPSEVRFSADDKFALFVSNVGGIVAGASDTNGSPDLYMIDLTTRARSILSANAAGEARGINASSLFNDFSPNSRYVVFVSDGVDLVTGVSDNNVATDVFVRDLQTGTTIPISISVDGVSLGDKASQSPVFTPDSRFVLFSSTATNLAPGVTDANDAADIYSRDLQANTTPLVSNNPDGVGAGTGGLETGKPFYLSNNGSVVAFGSTATNLVTRVPDTNAALDVFVVPPTGPGGVDGGGAGVDFAIGAITNVKAGNFVGGAKGGAARTTVQNVGSTDFKGTLAVQFYASADGTLDDADTPITPVVNKKLTLKHGGKPAAISLKFKYPTVPAGGSYFIIARADSTDAVAETNEGNNVAVAPTAIGIAPPFIDFSGASLTAKGTFTAGKRGAATLAVLNAGNVIAKSKVNVQLFASTDNSLDTTEDNVPLFDGLVSLSIKPGGTKNVALRADLAALTAGSYNLIAVIDNTNVVTESVESNNTVFSATPVTVV